MLFSPTGCAGCSTAAATIALGDHGIVRGGFEVGSASAALRADGETQTARPNLAAPRNAPLWCEYE
jgi:hypothetical protein